MKAKDLAAELLKHPELEVEIVVYTDASSVGTAGGSTVSEIEVIENKIIIFSEEGA